MKAKPVANYIPGKPVIWWYRVPGGNTIYRQIPGTFLSYSGKKSAWIEVDGERRRPLLENLEAVKEAR